MTEDYINGRVKWFDIKKGYGFIESCEEPSKEYFIHHARLNTDLKFSSLFDGEYVSFIVVNEQNKVMADDVKGISRGPLLCETRNEKRTYRENNQKNHDDGQEHGQDHGQDYGPDQEQDDGPDHEQDVSQDDEQDQGHE